MRVVVEILLWIAGAGVLFTLTRGFPGLAKALFSPIGLFLVAAAVILLVVVPRTLGRRPPHRNPPHGKNSR